MCGLAVKISIWNEQFSNGRGGPQARADFVLSEMPLGIEKIGKVEASAPKVSDISQGYQPLQRYNQRIYCNGALPFGQDEKRIDIDTVDPIPVLVREYGKPR